MNPNLLPDLATFVLIIEQGNFSAAAKASGSTPSAISRSVSRLEQALGSKLLHRTTRKLALSETGKMVYEHALRCCMRRKWPSTQAAADKLLRKAS